MSAAQCNMAARRHGCLVQLLYKYIWHRANSASLCCADSREHDGWHPLDAAHTLLLLDGKQLLREAELEVQQSCRPLPEGVTVAEAAAVMADVLQLESKHAAVKVWLPPWRSANCNSAIVPAISKMCLVPRKSLPPAA